MALESVYKQRAAEHVYFSPKSGAACQLGLIALERWENNLVGCDSCFKKSNKTKREHTEHSEGK